MAIRNKNCITRKNSFENIILSSKRNPNFFRTDRGKEFNNNMFQKFLNNNKIKLYSIKTYLGAVFAERFNLTIRILLKRPVFEKVESQWIDVLPTITKQFNNEKPSSIKLTPIQVQKRMTVMFTKVLLDKRKKVKPKYQVNDPVRTADLKKTFSKSVMTKCSYELYKITEVINDTIPSYRLDNLPERFFESLLK